MSFASELPNNDFDYPQHIDSADMYLQEKAHKKSMSDLKDHLLKQIEENGITNCGMTSREQVLKTFSRY